MWSAMASTRRGDPDRLGVADAGQHIPQPCEQYPAVPSEIPIGVDGQFLTEKACSTERLFETAFESRRRRSEIGGQGRLQTFDTRKEQRHMYIDVEGIDRPPDVPIRIDSRIIGMPDRPDCLRAALDSGPYDRSRRGDVRQLVMQGFMQEQCRCFPRRIGDVVKKHRRRDVMVGCASGARCGSPAQDTDQAGVHENLCGQFGENDRQQVVSSLEDLGESGFGRLEDRAYSKEITRDEGLYEEIEAPRDGGLERGRIPERYGGSRIVRTEMDRTSGRHGHPGSSHPQMVQHRGEDGLGFVGGETSTPPPADSRFLSS